ncbi:MAG: tol-pal system-associated acyl-CoA thioesterase [Rubrivivax sp.]|nr:tol-pal system-associated acyl-CoA thioesterase [Rubrivivax sp.]
MQSSPAALRPKPPALPRAAALAGHDTAAPAPVVYRLPLRVYWEDTDAGGIVFYANYLKFFERARTEWLRALGVHQQAMRERTGAIFVVTHTRTHHRAPARLDDALEVTVAVQHTGRASLQLAQQAWRGDTLLTDGEVRIGCVEAATLKPCRIPAEVLDLL